RAGPDHREPQIHPDRADALRPGRQSLSVQRHRPLLGDPLLADGLAQACAPGPVAIALQYPSPERPSTLADRAEDRRTEGEDMTLATPVGPLPQWGDHVSVLRAFWLLYRQPAEFRKCWEGLPTGQSLWAAVRLSSHLGFYLFLLSVAFNWLVQFLIPVLWRFSFQVGWMDAKPKNAWITLVFTTLVYTVVAWLELWRWRRPGNDDGAAEVERWGTDELQSARRILYRRVGWLFALPLLLLLAFSLQAETGDRVVRQVQALLTVYAPLVVFMLAVSP